MKDPCIDPELLERYASEPPSDEPWRAQVEQHAAGCAACRETLIAFGLARRGSDEEEAAVQALLARPPRPALAARLGLSRGTHWHLPAQRLFALAGTLGAALFALGVHQRMTDPVQIAASGLEGQRPFEGRSSLPVEPAPFLPVRGAREEGDRLGPTEGKLLQMKADRPEDVARPLAMVYLWRGGEGDVNRARALLEDAPPSAAVLSDRALVEMVDGNLEMARTLLAGALRSDPSFLPALFNQALVLQHLGRRDEARIAWQAYLAVAGTSEPAWSDEARQKLRDLGGP